MIEMEYADGGNLAESLARKTIRLTTRLYDDDFDVDGGCDEEERDDFVIMKTVRMTDDYHQHVMFRTEEKEIIHISTTF